MPESLEVVVKSITHQAEGINTFEFRLPDVGDLSSFSAGAHIDLQLANGMVRSYSLCNAQDERHRYVVAVNRDHASRGGSKKGSLYHYFPDGKEALGQAAVELAGELQSQMLLALAEKHKQPKAFVKAYCEVMAGWMEESDFRSGDPIATVMLETARQSRWQPSSATSKTSGIRSRWAPGRRPVIAQVSMARPGSA
jgi:hypothetical protein